RVCDYPVGWVSAQYRGQPDPLKGDALNKSVRETAQEALSAIFAGEDSSKPQISEGLTRRIEGFGNTNFSMPTNDNKSFVTEVVGIGSATIKQGLNSITQAQTQSKDETGTYTGPNLQRSLTNETIYSDGNRLSTRASGSWGQDLNTSGTDENGSATSSYSNEKSREERLIDTIVTSGGVSLQPTRDAIQVFLMEAMKLDALALSSVLEVAYVAGIHALVRLKAMCVLEAMLRKKYEHFSTVTSYFTENIDVVVNCSESPQATLREKANKVKYLLDVHVLSLLDGEQNGSRMSEPNLKTKKTVAQMPDLIDTNDPYRHEDFITTQTNENIASLSTSTTSLTNDFFMDGSTTDVQNNEHKKNDDPFTDVAFHREDEYDATDIFSGTATVDKRVGTSEPELFDILGSSSEIPGKSKNDLSDLLAGLSMNGNQSQNIYSDSTSCSSHKSNDVLNNILKSQPPNPMFLMNPMTYNALSSGMMFNNPTTFGSQPINYGAMSSLLAQQQQLLSAMANLQQIGNLQSQNFRTINASLNEAEGYNSALPDIFNPNIATQQPGSMMNNSKKEDTRAFDFISDHLAAAHDLRRVN
ncbi:ENTH/VHS-like protein, partial [Tanacetum coccineum]